MRLSTKDLLGIVAFCAVVAWCASRSGADNPSFWMGAGATVFISIVFVRMAKERNSGFLWLVLLPILGLCFLPIMALAALVNGILLLIVGIFSATRPSMPTRWLWFESLTCAAVSLIVGTVPAISEARRLEALRREFPVRSIVHRLSYEQAPRPSANASPGTVSPAVAHQLDQWEQTLRSNYRQHQFLQIHSREYERFVRASGFGVGRMVRPTLERLRRPPLRNIPFDAQPEAELEDERGAWNAVTWAGKSDRIEHLHEVSRADFFDPDGMGAVLEPRVSVVGFIEHGFHHPPTSGLESREQWTIERLELVSLLRFDEPRVYVLDHLPRMDQLSQDDIPTRPLDAFETAALEDLWTEKDLIVSDDGQNFRMVGSLRAINQCLDCHTAERGELLGAFSYVLRRLDDTSARP